MVVMISYLGLDSVRNAKENEGVRKCEKRENL
jgi:hypothetical protein